MEEPPDELRAAYQRDRDRILHSKAFRRLKGKTQVFIAPEGDHFRTRLTHTLEVAQIARTIARALGLNEDLTEAVGIGHDLGHTPFGHAGERALDEHLQGYGLRFHHSVQSVRVVTELEKRGRGLNLCANTIDGIRWHTKGPADLGAAKRLPATLEGQAVRLADRIAYVNHDLEDAVRAGALSWSDIPADIYAALGKSHGARIGTLVEDVVHASGQSGVVLSPERAAALDALKSFMFERVYLSPDQSRLGERAGEIVVELFAAAYNGSLDPDPVPPGPEGRAPRRVADWIAGMTDAYALRAHRGLEGGERDGLGVWPGLLGAGG